MEIPGPPSLLGLGRAAELDRPPFAPLGPGAEYRYRRARHELVLAIDRVSLRQAAAVERGEACFALAVLGPLLVFSYRFGATIPWASAAPYNWHFAPAPERVVPAAIPLTPETYARPWATLWITLVDADDGRTRAGRAVALRPEFAHALHGMLRTQALQPFHRADADQAFDRIRFATDPFTVNACAKTRCPGGWVSEVDGTVRRGHRYPSGRFS
jgi:hypothetical protein